MRVKRRRERFREIRGANGPNPPLYRGVRDVDAIELAGRQFNRVSHRQLLALGMSKQAIDRRVAARVLVAVEQGVYAIAPLLEYDDWGRWMGAVLTQPGSHPS